MHEAPFGTEKKVERQGKEIKRKKKKENQRMEVKLELPATKQTNVEIEEDLNH